MVEREEHSDGMFTVSEADRSGNTERCGVTVRAEELKLVLNQRL